MENFKNDLKDYGIFLGYSLYVGVCVVGAIIGAVALDEATRQKVREAF